MKRLCWIGIGTMMTLAIMGFAKGFQFSKSLETIPKSEAVPLPEIVQNSNRPLVAFGPNEQLIYDIHYGPIPAGRAALEVHPMSNGLWKLEARGWSRKFYDWVFPVRDSYISHFNPNTQLPERFLRNVREGNYRLNQDYEFNWAAGWCETEEHRRRTPETEDAFALKCRMHDLVSAFYVMRNMDFSQMVPGSHLTMPTLVDGELISLQVTLVARENIQWEGKTTQTLRFQPVIQEGRIWKSRDDLTLWVSDDNRHIPLLIQTDLLIGSLKIRLQSNS